MMLARMLLLALGALSVAQISQAAPSAGLLAAAPSFTIANDQFVQDGKVTHLRAGCIHYSRVPPEYWEDRLLRLKAMGLNAIQTYVPWNWHEPIEGHFNFEGDRDLSKFLTTAQKVGLLVVLRAGPYMCGEWEFGGLPAWLFKNGSIPLRTYSQPYISYVDRWWQDQLLPLLKGHLYSAGGNVVMVQCENEYGSYGDVSKHPTDMQYMVHLIDMARTVLGKDVILFTTDGGDEGYMTRGSIKGSSVYTVGDGCGNPQTCVNAQKAFNAPGQSPFMCSECYTGWLTHWGEKGANTSSSAPHVDSILGQFDGSISLYMGHGGTNWGFFSGANGGGGTSFQPHITSYDYDSPVSEAGEHGYHSGTDKYMAMQTVLKKYASPDEALALPPEPPLPPRTAYGELKMTSVAPLLSNLKVLAPTAAATATSTTPAAETLGPACHYGMMLYSKTLTSRDLLDLDAAGSGGLSISAGGLRDRAQIFVDGIEMGTLYRVTNPTAAIALSGLKAGAVLQLLVENMGRINFSHGMDDDRKGITGSISLGGKQLTGGWTTHCLPLDANVFGELKWETSSSTLPAGPAFYKAEFDTPEAMDTFLATKGWTKGIAWMNGFNLGRYWETEGPQHTLYVPAPRLNNRTKNELVVLELHNASASKNFSLQGEPELQPSAGDHSTGCDPTVGAKTGAHVAMVASGPKLAHQQQWLKKPHATLAGKFSLALKAVPTLCMAVEPGCPNAAQGCVSMQQCSTSAAGQVFEFAPDPKPNPLKPGAQLIKTSGGKCLDIFGHEVLDGAALEVFGCYGPGEDNQRWRFDEETDTVASYEVIQKHVPFVITVCTKPTEL